MAYVSKTTDSGVIGFKPGTRVEILEDKGDTILVGSGPDQIEVPAKNLTNDLDLAALASRRDVISQRQLSATLQRAYVESRAEQNKLNLLIDQQQKETDQRLRNEKNGGSRSPLIYGGSPPKRP